MRWTLDVDPKHLGFPDEETMTTTDGLVENHHYQDLRWLDWDDFDRWLVEEQEILDYDGDLQSDEADEFFIEQDNEVWCMGLDPGVATAVAALAAIGCCPVTSCNGWPGHFETHPLVLVWCEQEHLDLIWKATRNMGGGVEVEGVSNGILIYSHLDTSIMQDFARSLSDVVRGGSLLDWSA